MRQPRRHVGVDGPEHRAVGQVDRGAHEPGGDGAPGHELAEQLRVVVVDAEDALVERLLGGPDAGGHGAGQRASESLCGVDRHGSASL
jgi:hypothetical protein